MRTWFLFLALFCPTARGAEVEGFLSSREIVSAPMPGENCVPGDLFAVIAQGETEAHAVGEALRYENGRCALSVRMHSSSLLVRPGDRLEALDLEERDGKLRGRFDLIREGRRKISSRYKPLVYGGYLYGQTASTLDNNEFLVGLGPVAYGVTDRLQIDTAPLPFFAKVAQGGVKYLIKLNEDMRLTPYLRGYRYFDIGKGAWDFSLLYDSTSNGRSMSHTRLVFRSKTPDSIPLDDKDKRKKSSIELSTIQEWILPSWHRILFGPKFISGEEKDLGASLSFIFVLNSLHAAVNLEVNTIKKLDFRNNKQSLSGDLFWRF